MNKKVLINKIITTALTIAFVASISVGCEKKEVPVSQNTSIQITPPKSPSSTVSPTSTSVQSTITYIDGSLLATQDLQFKFNNDDFTIYDSKTKKVLMLGMSKIQIDKILGYPSKKIDINGFYNYNGLKIYFRDEIIASFLIESTTPNSYRYYTNRLIGLNDGLEDIKKEYGQGNENKSNSSIIVSYYVKKDNNEIKPLNIAEYRSDEKNRIYDKNVFGLSFIVDKKGKVNFISISDYRYDHELE